MNKMIAKFMLADFAKSYDYDVSYLEHLADVSPGAFYRYLACTPLATYRKSAPADVYLVAKMVATKHFDCGPCLRLVINMAREEKISDKDIYSALTGDECNLSDERLIARNYANAVVTMNSAQLIDLEPQIIERWGEAALNEIALAIAFAAFFPILRRGMGHAHSCEPVIDELSEMVNSTQQPVSGKLTGAEVGFSKEFGFSKDTG